jgi:hypothetical protein
MTPPPDNSDPRDYVLDLSTTNTVPSTTETPTAAKADYLSIHFRCCGVYAPIYRNAAATAYAGHCPKCRRAARIPIAPGGETSRVFTAQ